eukprot:6099188-Pyramimonas_sp.AAC.1
MPSCLHGRGDVWTYGQGSRATRLPYWESTGHVTHSHLGVFCATAHAILPPVAQANNIPRWLIPVFSLLGRTNPTRQHISHVEHKLSWAPPTSNRWVKQGAPTLSETNGAIAGLPPRTGSMELSGEVSVCPPRGRPVHIALNFALIRARGLPGPMTRQLACEGPTGGPHAEEDNTMPSL